MLSYSHDGVRIDWKKYEMLGKLITGAIDPASHPEMVLEVVEARGAFLVQ